MVIGDPSTFAIESSMTQAYERLSLRALGFFVLHVGGQSYGCRASDSTMLAGALDEVAERLADRGRHVAPFATDPDAGKIADAFRNAIYAERQAESYFGLTLAEFTNLIYANHLDDWAAHSDEAFDDGSCILQFDVGGRVRLVAFKVGEGQRHDPATLRDVWLSDDDFYGALKKWRDTFESEWAKSPKLKESTEPSAP